MAMSTRHALRALLVCAALLPVLAHARCAPFDLLKSSAQVPYIVHGKVTQSNKAEVSAAACNPKACRHHFTVQVISVLKGRIDSTALQVQYDYLNQRENMVLFADGDEFVFALRKVGADGQATLLGTTCGRAGVGVQQLDTLRQALAPR